MATESLDVHAALERFYAEIRPLDLGPLWTAKGLLPEQPRSAAVPYVWRYEVVREQLMRAGELVSEEQAKRRVLMLLNPGLEGAAASTANLYAGLQLVLPGEIAPAHHHAAAAIRFVLEGEGAYTTVDGERAIMHPGDLVLTPNWTWHDHGNETDVPMVWLDGLDIPLVNAVEANFFEVGENRQQEVTRPDNASSKLYATSRLNPAWVSWTKPYSPLFNYPWTETARVLEAVAGDEVGSPFDGVIFEYTNPDTGGACMPTMGCFVQQLAPGQHTDAHRHTTSTVYAVVSGNGATIVDGARLDWGPRDIFAVPGWAVHEHLNRASDEPAILFSFTDDPALRALALYREEPAERQG